MALRHSKTISKVLLKATEKGIKLTFISLIVNILRVIVAQITNVL